MITFSNENKPSFKTLTVFEKTALKLEKYISKSLSPTESLLSFSIGKLYFSYDTKPSFEYTNLEGMICIIINRTSSSLSIHIYDNVDIQKQFEIELYTNIVQGYHIMTDTFHAIEFPTFFLGLHFPSIPYAETFKESLFVHSIILDGTKRQSCYKVEDNTKKNSIGITAATDIYEKTAGGKMIIEHVDELVKFQFDPKSAELIYDVPKEFSRYVDSLGVSISKMNSDYEDQRKQVNFNKDEILRKNQIGNDISLEEIVDKEIMMIKKEEDVKEKMEDLLKKNKVHKKFRRIHKMKGNEERNDMHDQEIRLEETDKSIEKNKEKSKEKDKGKDKGKEKKKSKEKDIKKEKDKEKTKSKQTEKKKEIDKTNIKEQKQINKDSRYVNDEEIEEDINDNRYINTKKKLNLNKNKNKEQITNQSQSSKRHHYTNPLDQNSHSSK